MKEEINNLLNKYFDEFKDERNYLKELLDFVLLTPSEDLTNWNNFNGHIVASGFIYAKREKKFLVIYHNDFQMYVYPGGHVDNTDESILTAAVREIEEETGIKDLKQIDYFNDPLVPIDIEIHKIGYNEKLNLPEHLHFDFRYFFVIDKIEDIVLENNEVSSYKWVTVDEFKTIIHGKNVCDKIDKIISRI